MAAKHCRPGRKKRQRGFSIIEVAISVLVLGSVLVASSQLLCIGKRAADTDKSRAVVLNELERKVEMLRQKGFDLLESEPRAPVDGGAGIDCDIEVTVTEVSEYLKAVAVILYRQNDDGAEVQESVEFCVAECAFPVERTW